MFSQHQHLVTQYQWPLVAAGLVMLLIVLLGVRLWGIGQHLKAERNQVGKQQAQLAESALRWKLAVQASGGGLWDWNVQTGELFRSDQMVRLLGFTPGELDDAPGEWESLLHPEDRQATLALVQDCLQGRVEVYAHEHRVRCKDGHYKWFLARGQVVSRDAAGAPLRMIGIDSDITARKSSEAQLQLAASVFNSSREGIVFTDAQRNIIDVNQAFSSITGYSREETLGQNPRLMNSGQQDEAFYAAMFADLEAKDHWSGELWNRRKNGELYAEMLTITAVRNARGQLLHYVGMFTDITQLKAHQQQLEHLAHFDALTHLPNRVLLADRLQQAMLQAQRRGQLLAVAYLDMDGFKKVNDTYGHDVGDQLLMAVSSAMKQVLREGDTLARIGGDEFVAVLTDFADVNDCACTLERMLQAVAQPMRLGDLALQVSASLGVAFYPQPELVAPDQLMRQADQSMYQAKLLGKNRFHVFDATQDRHARGLNERIDDMVKALEHHEFVLYYQPKVNLRTNQVVGVEALIRWQHPVKGLLCPAHFLPLIEHHGFSVVLGDWVLDTALAQMAQWQAQGLRLPVSVNLSPRQLQRDDFVAHLRATLACHPQVASEWLTLEVLETSVLDDLLRTGQILADCARLGVAFALDDFGTGYSSLTHLKHLPVKQIKIDQSFVRGMLNDVDDLAILEGVISLTRAFKREVIAEGVESAQHGARLLQLGCELAQGNGIAKPMPAADVAHWVAHWPSAPEWLK